MKMNSISGVMIYVKDLSKTVGFYESLGFRIGKETDDRVACYVNWFWVEFVAASSEEDPEMKKEAAAASKGLGQFLYIKVDSVDDFYKGVTDLGMKPESEPQVKPTGNREFVLRDPDGYKLVFFEKK